MWTRAVWFDWNAEITIPQYVTTPVRKGLHKYIHKANKFANVHGAHANSAIAHVSQLSAGDLL